MDVTKTKNLNSGTLFLTRVVTDVDLIIECLVDLGLTRNNFSSGSARIRGLAGL